MPIKNTEWLWGIVRNEIRVVINTPSIMPVLMIKPTSQWKMLRQPLAEVPFSEHAGGVIGGEMLPEGDFVFTNHRAALNGVPDAGAVGPVTCEKRGTGRRAGRSNVVVGEDG